MENQKCGVYQIRCRANGEIYVGSSVRIRQRWYEHRKHLRNGVSHCRYLQNAWTKHGEAAFHFSILEECNRDVLEEREQFYIDTLKPRFNAITDIKRRFGVEMRAKIAAASKARAALRTHCPHGHLYDEANTYLNKAGEKICRACNAKRVSAIYASETPKQREARRARVKSDYETNRDGRRAQIKEYAAGRKAEKAEYDRLHRAESARRKREARQNETPEQRDKRLERKRDLYRRNRHSSPG